MRIADSSTALASEYSVNESFSMNTSRETQTGQTTTSLNNALEINISSEGLDMLQQSGGAVKTLSYSAASVDRTMMRSVSISSKEELQLAMLTRLLEGLTGKKISFRALAPELTDKLGELKNEPITLQNMPKPLQFEVPVRTSQTTTTITSNYQREDRMQFSAAAQVTTTDGMKIDLSINLSMSRSFASSQSISWTTEVQYCDPLVFNFNGRGVELLGETFNFDINNDGISNQISLLAEGNGFLALDLNGDGAIGDGGELFGTKSGNGFADLAAYDSDGNGWIDENDDVFDKLQIMFVDKDGNQRLFALGELGIGAIYLGNVQSSYELRDDQNEAQGIITHSGFFLYENGNAGLVQNVNFRMYDTPAYDALLYDTVV